MTHQYRAFISYSHADKLQARRLLRRLQTYRLPKSIASDGERRLGDFFMDRDSLPAAGNLPDIIRAGLSQSQSLIVLCSPSAAASHWVTKEIETFRELHPGGEILPVILSGEPKAVSANQTCFPPALTSSGNEPLAADIRKAGDGPKLGFLKLVSALSNTRLEDLLRRDQARSRRRVTAITATAAAITLGMSTLAAVAVTARGEAEARRAEAEGLVDFMLTDLRDELEPVGRLGALRGAAERALVYYDSVAPKQIGCETAEQQARAYGFAADVAMFDEDFERVAAHARHANELLESKSPDCRGRAAFLQARSDTSFYLARSAFAGAIASDWTEFIKDQVRYADRMCSLSGDSDPECLTTQAFAANSEGIVALYGEVPNPDAAINHFSKAIGYYAIHPDFEAFDKTLRIYHAQDHGWLAEAHMRADDLVSAIEARRKQTELLHTLRGRTDTNNEIDWELRRRDATAKLGLSRLLILNDASSEARLILKDLSEEAAVLRSFDPDNDAWGNFYAWVLFALAVAESQSDNPDEACEALQQLNLPENDFENAIEKLALELTLPAPQTCLN